MPRTNDGQASRLTVLGPGKRPYFVLCRCVCGNTKEIYRYNVGTHTRSCGCLHDEKTAALNKKHGATGTRTHNIWKRMIQRCTDSNADDYKYYGGRGITVCERWLGADGFANFLSDMGEAPPKLTIDRKENSKGYEPGNCRWASRAEQMRNTRSNRRITHNGETKCLIEWSRSTGLGINVIRSRLVAGWDMGDILKLTRTGSGKGKPYRKGPK